MPHLRLILIHLWVGSIAGAVVIAGLSLGYVGLPTFLWAGIIGVLLGVPAALTNWVYLRPRRSQQQGWTWAPARWARRKALEHPGPQIQDPARP